MTWWTVSSFEIGQLPSSALSDKKKLPKVFSDRVVKDFFFGVATVRHMIEQDASVGSFIITEATMSSGNGHALARMAILTLAEIKEVAAAFDGGEINLFDALDAVRVAVEAYQGEAQQQAWRGAA